MKLSTAIEQGYTHDAEMYGVPIYYREHDAGVHAKNTSMEYWLDFLFWIECNFGINDYGFPIKIKGRL